MSVTYSKNVVIASGTILGGFEEGVVNSNVYSGTVVARQADGTFSAGNQGELFVVLEDAGHTAKDGHNAGNVVRLAPITKPLVINFVLAAGLDVKAGYALYANEQGLVTNVGDKDAKVIAYAREDVVTVDSVKQIAASAQ